MKINIELADRVRKPNIWGTYKRPIDNLIHGILIQAICDAHGYKDTSSHHYVNGDDALQFLSESGLQYFQHLLDAPKNPVSAGAHKGRLQHLRKKMRGVNNG